MNTWPKRFWKAGALGALFVWSLFCVTCCTVLQNPPPIGHVTLSLPLPAPPPTFFAPPTEFAAHQMRCLALNVYFEARGENIAGQYAVAFVTINRLRASAFPNNLCGVVFQTRAAVCQFSWHCDRYSDRPKESRAWHRAEQVAAGVWYGYYKHDLLPDNTNGALYFFNPKKVNGRIGKDSVVTIGHQVFYN